MGGVQEVSVIVPTIGRARLLRRCLESLGACDPRPAEILVCDQSDDDRVANLVQALAVPGSRRVACATPGIAANVNTGMRAAGNEAVLVTHDDCTVASDWVAVGARMLRRFPGGVVTGRVLAVGDPVMTPGFLDDPEPHDYVGPGHFNRLRVNNLALHRTPALEIGFDERPGFRRAAEDFDFCYRWCLAGGSIHYRPELLVWHHDWRTPAELERTYRVYARARGAFFAKHLAAGDRQMIRLVRRSIWGGCKALGSRLVRGRPAWTDHRRALLTGVPAGLVAGLWEDRRLRSAVDRRYPG